MASMTTQKTRPSHLPRPTEAELSILRILWQRGAATVRDIHEELAVNNHSEGYTTVLKLMQIMHHKGLLSRDESQRAHIYEPVIDKETAQREFLGEFVHRVFDGSRAQLVIQALGQGKTSPEERARIRALLDTMESDK